MIDVGALRLGEQADNPQFSGGDERREQRLGLAASTNCAIAIGSQKESCYAGAETCNERRFSTVSRRDDTLSIFLTQRPALIRYAASLIGDRAEAEDLVQEAWLRFNAVAASRWIEEPAGYLHRIVRNLILDGRRRQSLERRLFDANAERVAETVPSDEPSASATAEAKDELAIVRDTIAAMPERMRIAFEMHRFQGVKLVDIAAHLRISKSLAHELVVEGVEWCKQALQKGR